MFTQRTKSLAALGAVATLVVVGLAARPAEPIAQAAADGRLGWVNSEKILQALPEYAAAESTYQVELASYRAEVQRMSAQLDSMKAALDQQAIVLSPSAKQARQDSITAMDRRSQARYNELQQKAVQRERELTAPVEQRIKAVIEGIRAERNLAFIFDVSAQGSAVVAADLTLDLTPVVLQRLRAAPPAPTPTKTTGRGRGGQ
jgi:outer membrane protein